MIKKACLILIGAALLGVASGLAIGVVIHKEYVKTHPYEPTVYDAIDRVNKLKEEKGE